MTSPPSVIISIHLALFGTYYDTSRAGFSGLIPYNLSKGQNFAYEMFIYTRTGINISNGTSKYIFITLAWGKGRGLPKYNISGTSMDLFGPRILNRIEIFWSKFGQDPDY